MNLSARTLRLQNATHMNVSLTLQQMRGVASPGFRRGVALTSVCVPAGGHIDLCRVLGVPMDEVRKILEGSPEYHLHKSKQRIYVMEYPPIQPAPMIQAGPQAGPDAPMGTVTTVSAPSGPPVLIQAPVPVPGEPVVLHSPLREEALLETMARSELRVGAPDSSVFDPPPEDLPLPPPPTGPVAEVLAGAAEDEIAIPVTEPSMDWSEDQLRAYAVARGVDVTKARSKTAVLRTIRKPVGVV